MDALRQKSSDTSLSADDKRVISLARINSTALSNPVADFSEEDMATMRDTIKKANAILSKSAGMSDDSTAPDKGGKKRVKVKGPDGQTGTIVAGDKLPDGWSVVGGK